MLRPALGPLGAVVGKSLKGQQSWKAAHRKTEHLLLLGAARFFERGLPQDLE